MIPGVISKESCGGRDVLCQSHVIYVDKECPRTVPCQTPEVTSVSSTEGYSCNRLTSVSFFLVILAQSNYDHYARESDFGILKKKKSKTKKQKQSKKSFSCVLISVTR